MKLGSGICPVTALKNAGITVALGTDGCSSNNDLDMFGEMDTAAKLQKAARLDPAAFSAAQVLASATIEGARAVGLDQKIGSLEKGKAADLIRVSVKAPHMVPMYDPVSHLVYAAKGSDVTHVMVDGAWRVFDRKPAGLDMDGILARAAEIAASVKRPAPS